VIADLDGDGSLTTRYLRGDVVDQLFARIDTDGETTTPFWYLTDHLGSIREVITETVYGRELMPVSLEERRAKRSRLRYFFSLRFARKIPWSAMFPV